MNKLDDIEKRLDERMAEIERRINGDDPVPVSSRAATSCEPMEAGNNAVSGDGPSPPVDDSAAPTLNPGDVSAVSALDFRLAGLKPGDKLPLTGGRFAGDPQDDYDKLWSVIVDGAREANVILGSCDVVADGNGVGGRHFDGPTVFCRGIPDPSADPALQVQRFVAMAAAYYLRRWQFFGVNDIHTLWAWARAEFSGEVLQRVSYCPNAFSGYRGNGSTYLCFSPQCSSQDTAGHEFTHSVSNDRVQWLEYRGETGATNESFSDIFAKFSSWAWNGRELADSKRWIYSGVRDMAHPENRIETMGIPVGGNKIKKVPWRPPSYYLQKVKVTKANTPKGEVQVYSGWYVGPDDNNGVHCNNGVIARLCFLLCEGERFVRDDGRGFEVKPIGFDRTEELFGQLMFGPRRYLPKACNMYSFCNGIALAAQDLNFSSEERRRLITACDAVNIIPPQGSAKYGNIAAMERKLTAVRSNMPGSPAMHYSRAMAQEFSSELGLNAAGAGFSVQEESVVKPADLHAAVPTGGEVQIVLEQTWNGMPVYGASAIARLRDGDTVTYLQNGFSNSLGALRTDTSVDADVARNVVVSEGHGQVVSLIRKIVYDPSLLGLDGQACVAWLVRTESGGVPQEQCIVDASSGRIVRSSPLRIVD